MEILEFVKLETIDPVSFNASYYVTPDRGGEKPYSLLFEAMRKSGYAAPARFAMHGREQILALHPGKRASSCTRSSSKAKFMAKTSMPPILRSSQRRR
jgi:non-homologous end joining protein Ku